MVGESSTGSFTDAKVTSGSHYQYYLLPVQKKEDGSVKMELPSVPVVIDIPASVTGGVY